MAKRSASPVLAHWYKPFENFQTSPLDFYTAVEAALTRREIPNTATSRVDFTESGTFTARREYLRISRGNVHYDICAAPFGTSFFFSSWLTETRVWWALVAFFGVLCVGMPLAFVLLLIVTLKSFGFLGALAFSLIGAMAATPLAVFVTVSILNESCPGWDDPLLAMPIIGQLYEAVFRPITYYRLDTALMFQSAVHAAVLEVIDDLTTTKGLRALSEQERKPMIEGFFGQ